ncbi:MAG TPA: xanthine dehydrogenase family protein molybdopterin-binding subunit [Stellaceae bacterium]|nr:xanthine dehydrogenase family protein molybdopterin-binding subunit [Stellaceae bacterium]
MAADDHRPADWAPRIEDAPLLQGRGRFMDDLHAPGQAAACFLRSPHAFARIGAIDVAEALALPGVLAVLTADDMKAAGTGSLSHPLPQTGRGGARLIVPHRPPLAGERAMHVGEPVALVVAETLAAAQEAAELVAVDYEPLAAVVDVADAVRPGAPQLWPEAPGNLALDWPGPRSDPEENRREVDRVFAAARHVVKVRLANQRIVVAAMETRGATASYDAGEDRYLLRVPSQGVGMLRDQLAASMRIERDRLRVVTDDVGGAFGAKTAAYAEYVALLVAAKRLGRPVHWVSTRSEAFVSDNQARDSITEAELALDEGGRFLALRVGVLANMGAFLSSHGAFIASSNFARCFPGMYDIPRIAVEVRCAFTNTVQIGPYRGAGRPEANYALERLIDAAARQTGIDRVALRRRNLIAPASMPYKTAVGTTYDSGEFAAVLEKALELADFSGFESRRARSAQAGRRRGIGVSCFLEHAGGQPGEEAAIGFPGGDRLTVAMAVQATGQGHATLFRRLAAARLGISEERVTVRQGDTRLDLAGTASVASRTTSAAGSAILRTVDLMLEKGRRIASLLLEAAEVDIGYEGGDFIVAGTDRRISLFQVAERAAEMQRRGEIAEPLDTKARTEVPQTFPNGCHIAEVEIDPETGVVTLARYTAVDDCGTVLDHVLVEAQIHGGVAQGVGQALSEDAVFDRESGQLLAGSFMDYAMPRADGLPFFITAAHAVPCTTNPLGVKGTGEAGTTGALAAVMNAVADAIPGEAGAALDMPATAEKVWRACRALEPR